MSKRAYLVTVLVTRRVIADTEEVGQFFQSIENDPENPGIFQHHLGDFQIDTLKQDAYQAIAKAADEKAEAFAEDLSENIVAIIHDDELPYEEGE